MGHVLGIDIGSQSVKAVLCDPTGLPLATAAAPCAMSHPRSGWSEQAPSQWEGGIASAVREVVAAAGIAPSAVSHLGLAGQVDGVVPVGRDLRPLRDAIIWLDRRASDQADVLLEQLGSDAIFAISGLNVDASHTAPKMMWLRDVEPEVYAEAASLPPVTGYLVGWLTGQIVQDHANASSSLLYDVTTRAWSPTLLEAAGIEADRLAPIAAAHEPAGPLTRAAAEALGLTTDCVVVVGTGDDHGAALGAGAAGADVIADITGTAEPVAAVSLSPVWDDERVVETHAHAVEGSLLVENPGFVSGGSTLWLAGVLAATQGDVLDWAATAPVAADGVVFVPALSGSTAPRWNDRMRGAFHGLSMNHDRSHLSRAVLEGCAFALRDITDRLSALGLGGNEIHVVGGGSRSPLWMQIKADVTGVPARPVLGAEPTALGAAMLATVAAGAYADAVEAADQMVSLSEHGYEPDPVAHERYDGAYDAYRALFDALEPLSR